MALLLLAAQSDQYFFRDSINKNSQYDEVLLPYLEKEISDEDNDFIDATIDDYIDIKTLLYKRRVLNDINKSLE